MDADELIGIILNDDKIKNGSLFADKIYRDEPIIRRASQLTVERPAPPPKTAPTSPPLSEDIPEPIRRIREMEYSAEARLHSKEWLFVRQARAAEGFADSFGYTADLAAGKRFYGDFTVNELRYYFTLREAFRSGDFSTAPDPFVKLYLSELVNLVGAGTPREVFDKLADMTARLTSGRLIGIVRQLMTDVVIYYRLPPSLLENSERDSFDKAVAALTDCTERSDDELFAAVLTVSNYDLAGSRGYKKAPDDYKAAVCSVIRTLAGLKHFTSSRSFITWLFGYRLSRWYDPFRNVVFFYADNDRNDCFEINDSRRFYVSGRLWQESCYLTAKSPKLGKIVRDIDSLMRENLGTAKTIKRSDLKKTYAEHIDKAFGLYLEQRRAALKPKIEFDLSKLDDIRRTSEITRDKLIVDEDEPEITAPAEQPAPAAEAPAEEVTESECPLNDGERAFMQALLYGGDFDAAARSAGSLPTLLADSVNEKLFEEFGDTVIDFDGDKPAVIEDYADELKGMIPR